MNRTSSRLFLLGSLVLFVLLEPNTVRAASPSAPLVVGETFPLTSQVLGETRRINVYLPAGYAEDLAAKFPVLYMLDGGLGEDFLHVAGLVQVSVGNGTMRPFVLVGVENTERRRDLTGPTDNEEDKKVAPRVGGSAKFRSFLKTELMPEIERRYRTTAERAIVGESLAGLFVVETFFLEPDLFDSYLAFDPSLWWNDAKLLASVRERLGSRSEWAKTLYLANSGQKEISELTARLAAILRDAAPKGLHVFHTPMPMETHATIFHPAALAAFRKVLGPGTKP